MKATALATRWACKHPELATRLQRALKVLPHVSPQGENVWTVPSARTGEVYVVHADPHRRRSTCTCPDNAFGAKCKHILAAALRYMEERDVHPHGASGPVRGPAPGAGGRRHRRGSP